MLRVSDDFSMFWGPSLLILWCVSSLPWSLRGLTSCPERCTPGLQRPRSRGRGQRRVDAGRGSGNAGKSPSGWKPHAHCGCRLGGPAPPDCTSLPTVALSFLPERHPHSVLFLEETTQRPCGSLGHKASTGELRAGQREAARRAPGHTPPRLPTAATALGDT